MMILPSKQFCRRTHVEEFNVNPFLDIFPMLFPLKISENLRFLGVFRGYKMKP